LFHPEYSDLRFRGWKRAHIPRTGDSEYLFVENCPLHKFDLLGLKKYDANKGYLSQGLGDYHNMKSGDTVVNSSEVALINVLSGNLEKSKDPDFVKAKCVLKQIKFPLPTSENGVYWASWNDPTLNGLTVHWVGPFASDLNYTFISNSHQGASKKCDMRFIEFVVTLYHEVKGHNIDEAEHGTVAETTAFNAKYEGPIRQALLKDQTKICCACKVGP
jgi:hypothetical protein